MYMYVFNHNCGKKPVQWRPQSVFCRLAVCLPWVNMREHPVHNVQIRVDDHLYARRRTREKVLPQRTVLLLYLAILDSCYLCICPNIKFPGFGSYLNLKYQLPNDARNVTSEFRKSNELVPNSNLAATHGQSACRRPADGSMTPKGRRVHSLRQYSTGLWYDTTTHHSLSTRPAPEILRCVEQNMQPPHVYGTEPNKRQRTTICLFWLISETANVTRKNELGFQAKFIFRGANATGGACKDVDSCIRSIFLVARNKLQWGNVSYYKASEMGSCDKEVEVENKCMPINNR
ncbi:unnamed protein product [Leptidea sinapis]|uniref:Uncharacterized protein n=1 Tax=Leptidea sinapis TaxID=189913 RepID=A0A5E4Q002_9NEOP|nr:unnamed protein product [Leptidea sinapis]